MRRITTEERRALLGARHCLANRADSVEESVVSMVGFHSSDPSTVHLSAWARVDGFDVENLEKALYDNRSLLRLLGMRRTLWVVPRDFGPAVNFSSTVDIVEAQRRVNIRMLEEGGVTDDGAAWLDRVSAATLAALEERGESRAADLVRVVPELGAKIDVHSRSGAFQTTIGASTRVLFQLASEAKVIRARPAGSWVSGQYRWTTMKDWLGGDIPRLDPPDARGQVLESYLRSFGPVTEEDMRWWTGWTKAKTMEALQRIDVVEVGIDEGSAWMLEESDPVAPATWVALLPSLDPTTMGWKRREWYLGGHGPAVFDRNGNAGPTIWADGRVVGGWTVDGTARVVWELLEDPGKEHVAAIADRAAALERWLDGRVVTPRFRSPLDRALAG